ncbi:MAG: hypothetical protein GX665_05105 [Gammaproteobacteria bacterium]|nr:hypothetical protein [Gammaproteobacteria bacterium]
MAEFKVAKVVAAVPSPPEKDTLYFVRTGAGFDIYATNGIGEVVAYKLNAAGVEEAPLDGRAYARKDGGWVVAPSGDPLRDAAEAASGGLMTVRRDAANNANYFYKIPKFKCEDIDPSGSLGYGTHPAFIFNDAEDDYILVGAYQASNEAGRAVSQPGKQPWVSVNFDNARAACKGNGPGFDIISNLDWAAVALWCMANGFQPSGNVSSSAATLTGAGGAPWNHNNLQMGIADLVGNVWEWCSGLQARNYRAWLSPNNGKTEDADLINSGFDLPTSRTWSTVSNAGASDLVKQSLVAPASGGMAPNGYLTTSTQAAGVAYRGGIWNSGTNAGLAALYLYGARSSTGTNIGFRARFRDP